MNLAPLALLLAFQPVAQVKTAPAKMVGPAAAAPQKKPAAAPANPVSSEEQLLKSVHLDISGSALLEFFRKRAVSNVEAERLTALGNQLSDKTPAVHGKASAELVSIGPPAVPVLRRLVNNVDDEETAGRARKCLEAIEGHSGSNFVQSAVQLLAVRKPAGAAEALLDYLPLADDDTVVQEIETALLTVGLREGQPESALVRALSDPVPIRRGIAAHVLCQIGSKAGRNAIRPLLKDPRPSVRMRAALALADKNDTEAVTVLIDLVARLPAEGRLQVETYLTELAGEWAVKTPQNNDAASGRLRRDLWAAWWNSLDGAHLLEEFRGRTLGDEERLRVLDLIRKLADASPQVRSRASEELISLGARAAPLLRQAINQPNSREAQAARECLEMIERDSARPLPDAAPRLLALRRPEGTVEALLGYLPFAVSDAASTQIIDLLAVVGCADGKAAPALVGGLQDKVSLRRAAAAVALCKGKADEQRTAVRKLLSDPDATVRMKTAIALVEWGDKSAMPALITLLNDLPLEQVWEVEDLLGHLAGDETPSKRVGKDAASRKDSVKAWNEWWAKHEKTIDLAQLAGGTRDRGLLLVVEMQQGRVLEVSRTGQVRWKIEGLQWPWDAQVCPNGNVLIVDQSGNRVSLRDRQGKEVWTRGCNNAFGCQRMRNGNIFIMGRQQIQEIDANGKEVFSHNHNNDWLVGGRKFPDGHIAYLTQQGEYVRLDATGKRVKNFQIPFQWQNGVMGAEMLPGDRVVVSLSIGKVAEYADGGKLVWEASVVNPGFPHRLPNGNTLVSPMNQNTLLELNRNGKVVSEKKDLAYRPFRMHRR
jgi:HEAT repeat protein